MSYVIFKIGMTCAASALVVALIIALINAVTWQAPIVYGVARLFLGCGLALVSVALFVAVLKAD
jgi:hypothetical protein